LTFFAFYVKIRQNDECFKLFFSKGLFMKRSFALFILPGVILIMLFLTACGLITGEPTCAHTDENYDKICDKCGYEYTENSGGGDKPECQHKDADDNSVCDNCGDEYAENSGGGDKHECQHKDADDNSVCDNCGDEYTENSGGGDKPECQHKDADDNSVCDNCGDSFSDGNEPHTHKWIDAFSYDNSYHWKECESCEDKDSYSEHSFNVFNESGLCSVCGAPFASTEGVTYELSSDNSYALVTGYKGTATQVIIASEYNGVPVTSIKSKAFFGRKKVSKIIIPNSVTSIESYVFVDCISLTSIEIPNSVTTIKEKAFSYSSFTSINIPDSVTTIEAKAFAECPSLSNVTIPDSITTLESGLFTHCTSLVSITLPSSITTIKERAFEKCFNLESINIPASVTYIGNRAFSECHDLMNLVFEKTEGWSAGGDDVSGHLDDPVYAACTIRSPYCYANWERDESASQ